MNFDDVPGEFFVSTDKAMLDVPWIVSELQRTYWGSWMNLPTVLSAIQNSLCFGLYQRGQWTRTQDEIPTAINEPPRQIGFARVVTDYATFAWLCDVLVAKDYRGKKLGRFLVDTVMNHPEVKPRSVMLCTKDAHGLYRKFGFTDFNAMKRTGGQPAYAYTPPARAR